MQSVFVRGCRVAALVLAAVAPLSAQALDAVVATEEEVTRWRTLDGTVEAVNSSTVAAQTSGTVTALHVDVQDRVPKGALILEIDDTLQRARLEEARAALAEARAGLTDARNRFARMKELLQRQSVSQAEFDQASADLEAAKARVSSAEAAVNQAQRQLQYTRVHAPYGGVVVERHVDIGETVQPGTPLMTGQSLQLLRVTTQVPQRYAESVRRSGFAKVLMPDGGSLRSDSLTFYPVAGAGTHDFRVRVNLPEGSHGLYPGMALKVRFPVGRERVLTIPQSAVLYRSELRAVYVLGEDGRPRLRQIRPGERRNDRVEVLAGLAPGERVAADPVAAMAAVAEGRDGG